MYITCFPTMLKHGNGEGECLFKINLLTTNLKLSQPVALNSFLFLETSRTRCDFSGSKLYCFKWLCDFFKVTLRCTLNCFFKSHKLRLHCSVA